MPRWWQGGCAVLGARVVVLSTEGVLKQPSRTLICSADWVAGGWQLVWQLQQALLNNSQEVLGCSQSVELWQARGWQCATG